MSVDYGDGTIFDQYNNECWLRERIYLDPTYNLPNVIWLSVRQVEFRLSQTFSYFQKITANSNSHNVKKQMDPNGSIPIVQGFKKSVRRYLWILTIKNKP